jgi:hypothetical protein
LVEEGQRVVREVVNWGSLAIEGDGASGVRAAAVLVLFDSGVGEAAVCAFGEAGGGEELRGNGGWDVVGAVVAG